MNSLSLEDVAEGNVDAKVEQRLCDHYALNYEGKPVGRSLEALKRHEPDAVEEA